MFALVLCVAETTKNLQQLARPLRDISKSTDEIMRNNRHPGILAIILRNRSKTNCMQSEISLKIMKGRGKLEQGVKYTFSHKNSMGEIFDFRSSVK